MTSVALKGLAARKLRAVLTALAIVLGVAMVSGSYVLTDSIQRAFHSIFTSSYVHTDAVVTGKKLVDYSNAGSAPLPDRLVAKLRQQRGVAKATGLIMDMSGSATVTKLYDKQGKLITANGNPTFGFGIAPDAGEFNPLHLVTGTWASGPKQVVIDKNTADKHDFEVGDSIRATADTGTFTFRVTGIARFGNVDSLGGATFGIFDVPTAQKLYRMGHNVSAISASATSGVSSAQLVSELRSVVPGYAQVRTGAEQAAKDEKDVAGFVKFIRYFLVSFGMIALFVGGFVIFNTLSITVAQRTRELATLRTLGASRRQVLRSVIMEAFAIGAVASVLGLAAGVGLAKGLSSLFAALSLSLPESGLPVETRTIVVSLLLGTILTVIAGTIPAVRATRVPPIAAVREGSTAVDHKLSKVAPVAAAVLGSIAAALLGYGFFVHGVPAGQRILVLVGGMLVMFIALAAIFSRLVRPLVAVLSVPFVRLGRTSGELAVFNVKRNPGRTASTAAALMIGITLVTFITVFAGALRGADEKAWKKQVTADYVVQSENGWETFPPVAADAATSVPGVQLLTHVRGDRGRVGTDGNAGINGVEPAAAGKVLHLDFKQGSMADLAALRGNEAIVKDRFAAKHGIKVGEGFVFQGSDGRKTTLVAKAIFESPKLDSLLNAVIVPIDTFDRVLPRPRDAYAFVNVAGGAGDRTTTALAAAYGKDQVAKSFTREGFAKEKAKWMSQMLNMVYVLLALSVIVSLFGIVNTLALAVFERTRELGMLRAVGMTRRQVRRMIRRESQLTALLGAALGLPVGVGLAALATTGLRGYGLALSIPIGTLVTFVVLAILVGVLAAILPARRAGKLNVLAALQYE